MKKNKLEKKIWSEAGYYKLIDEFGIGWKMPIEGGHFFDLYKHPLRDAETVEDIENYPWPDALDPGRYADLKKRADCIVFKEEKAWKWKDTTCLMIFIIRKVIFGLGRKQTTW